MAFEKGKSGNPVGRKKGVPNKTTKELREMLQYILYINFDNKQITKDLKTLTPKYRLDFFLKLLENVLPRPTELVENESIEDRHSAFVENIIEKMGIMAKEKKVNPRL